MTDKKLCRFCHATVEHHGMFCINCGAPIEEPSHGDLETRPSELQIVLNEIGRLEELRDQRVVPEKEFQERRRNLIATLPENQSKSSTGGGKA